MLDYTHGSRIESRFWGNFLVSIFFMAAMNVLALHRSPGGIPKSEIAEAQVTERGIAGDDWAHPKYHGGPNQALLLIGSEVLADLKDLGFSVGAGSLGENVTTAGLDYRALTSGQRLSLGEQVKIELTKLREPCRTLDVYNNANAGRIQKVLKLEGRGGWYARVLEGGVLRKGDGISLA
jgi:MOSC domain-containing protein YiiM